MFENLRMVFYKSVKKGQELCPQGLFLKKPKRKSNSIKEGANENLPFFISSSRRSPCAN